MTSPALTSAMAPQENASCPKTIFPNVLQIHPVVAAVRNLVPLIFLAIVVACSTWMVFANAHSASMLSNVESLIDVVFALEISAVDELLGHELCGVGVTVPVTHGTGQILEKLFDMNHAQLQHQAGFVQCRRSQQCRYFATIVQFDLENPLVRHPCSGWASTRANYEMAKLVDKNHHDNV